VYRYVSCQSFAGGFDVGMVQAGYELVHKVEMEGGFGMANCLANRHILGQNWTHQATTYTEWYAPQVDVVAANPPCSGFSLMTDQRHRGMDSKINQCMWALVEYTAKVRPTVMVMESVRQAYTQGHDLMRRLRAKLEDETNLRYDAYHVFQDALELGGAARRPRYFLVLSQVPFGVDYPVLDQTPLLIDVWSDLRDHAMTWEAQPYRKPATWWTEPLRSETGTFDGHVARVGLPTRRALDLLEVADRNGGWPGGWAIGKMAKHIYDTTGSLPASWDHMIPRLKEKNFEMGFTSVNRWDAQKVGRVITGAAVDMVLHPWEPRTITHREAARVMGFPDDWLIKPLESQSNLRATWGKGISTQCGRWIGEQVARALDGQHGSITGQSVGDREWFINSGARTSPETAALREAVLV
jgi:DNA (cytosine-5)-methyltransferase 1